MDNKKCQCCTCEQEFNYGELLKGCCPHCFSGNWIIGNIDLED